MNFNCIDILFATYLFGSCAGLDDVTWAIANCRAAHYILILLLHGLTLIWHFGDAIQVPSLVRLPLLWEFALVILVHTTLTGFSRESRWVGWTIELRFVALYGAIVYILVWQITHSIPTVIAIIRWVRLVPLVGRLRDLPRPWSTMVDISISPIDLSKHLLLSIAPVVLASLTSVCTLHFLHLLVCKWLTMYNRTAAASKCRCALRILVVDSSLHKWLVLALPMAGHGSSVLAIDYISIIRDLMQLAASTVMYLVGFWPKAQFYLVVTDLHLTRLLEVVYTWRLWWDAP